MHSFSAYLAKMPKNKTLRQIVGDNAKQIRAAKKLSQPAVAAEAKRRGGQIDQTTVGRVERAEFPASVDTLESLAKGLGVDPWLLLIPGASDQKFLAILSSWADADDRGRRLLSIAATAAIDEGEHHGQTKQRAAGGHS